jgi:hypothetical protein
MSSPAAAFYPSRCARPGLLALLGLIALVAGGKAVLFDTLDPDCFWHLRVAEQLKAEGVRPLVDRMSFASVQTPWTPYSWLAELAMKAVWDCGGWRAAVAAQALMQAAFVAVVGLACCSMRAAGGARSRFLPAPGVVAEDICETSRLSAVLATAFATFVSLPYLSFRPVTAALVVLAACVWLLVRDRAHGERSRAVVMVMPLTALAVNLHLYAIFVPMALALLAAGAVWERVTGAEPAERPEADRRVMRYLLLFGGCGLACLATPMLRGTISTALHYGAFDPMVSSGVLAEMRPFFHGPMGKVSAVLVLLAFACVVWNRRRLRAGELLVAAASVVLLSRMGRFAPLMAIVAAPMLAVTLPQLSDRVLARPLVPIAACLVLLAGVLRVARAFPPGDVPMAAWVNRHGPEAPGYPCDAADFVAAKVTPVTGRLITEFTWGGYLEWRLGDRYQLFLDGRTQLFSPEFWRATYLNGHEERRRFLSHVRADAAILPAGSSLFRHSLVRLGWTSVYRDERAEVLVPPPGDPLADQQERERRWSLASLLSGD